MLEVRALVTLVVVPVTVLLRPLELTFGLIVVGVVVVSVGGDDDAVVDVVGELVGLLELLELLE